MNPGVSEARRLYHIGPDEGRDDHGAVEWKPPPIGEPDLAGDDLLHGHVNGTRVAMRIVEDLLPQNDSLTVRHLHQVTTVVLHSTGASH